MTERRRHTDLRALVTGAGSGIGAAVAEHLARRGARVALVGRSRPRLECVATRTGALDRVRSVVADVRRADEVRRAVDEIVTWLGRLDVVVNSAGIYREGPFDEMTDAVLDDLIDTNFRGVALVCRSVIPWMERGGCIVNIGSMSAVRPLEEQALYAASKAAVVHLGACLARELAPRGIRVGTVSPGPTRTRILETIMSPERIPAVQAALERRIPLARLGEPDEIAEAVEYLARATFATGAHLVLDGGITL